VLALATEWIIVPFIEIGKGELKEEYIPSPRFYIFFLIVFFPTLSSFDQFRDILPA
jgi:hypothetical protein